MLLPVLEVLTGAGVAVAVFVLSRRLVGLMPREARRGPTAIAATAAAAGVAAAVFGGPATGTQVLDAVFNVTTVVLFALGMSRVDRLLALTVAGVAFVCVGATPFAGAAVGLGLTMATSGHRVPALKAALGGLVGLAVVTRIWTGPNLVVDAAAVVCVVAVWAGARGRMGAVGRHRVRVGTAVVTVALGGAVAAFGTALYLSLDELERSAGLAARGLAQVRAGEELAARASLTRAASGFEASHGRLNSWWARGVDVAPVAAQNARALRAMALSGRNVARQAATAIEAGDPGALQVTGARLPLEAADRLLEAIDLVVTELKRADAALASSSSTWLVSPVARARQEVETGVREALPPTIQAHHVLKVVPGLFGAQAQRRYFLALMTPSEQRATGGVIGTYGLIAASGGHLTLEAVGSDTDLNVAGVPPGSRRLVAPEDFVRRYGGYHPEWFWQNVNMSPDFPTVGGVIQGLFPQSGGPEIDGAIAVDPTGLAQILSVVGPMKIAGWPVPLSSENVERVLLHDHYVVYEGRREARKDFLEAVVQGTYDRLAASTLPGPRRLADLFGPVVRSRHLMFFSSAPDEQAAFAKVKADGALAPVRGDYLAVVTQNSSGNKIDWFFERKLRYDVQIDPDRGAVTGRIQVSLRNNAPATGFGNLITGSVGSAPTPSGFNRILVSVYTPLQASSVTLDGVPVTFEQDRELGRTVISAFVTVPPTSERVLTIDVRGTVGRLHDYELDIGPQALVVPEDMTVIVSAPPGWILTPPSGWVRTSRSTAGRRTPLTEPTRAVVRLTRPD